MFEVLAVVIMKTVLVQWIDGGLISLLRISSLIQ